MRRIARSEARRTVGMALPAPNSTAASLFPNLPRFGVRAGQPNENFLNADLFATAFVKPLEPFQRNVGLLIFEFS